MKGMLVVRLFTINLTLPMSFSGARQTIEDDIPVAIEYRQGKSKFNILFPAKALSMCIGREKQFMEFLPDSESMQ